MLPNTYRGPAQLAADIPLSGFAMVMATGITSAELRLTGHLPLAAATLILAVRHRRRPVTGPGPAGRKRYKCQALIKLVPVADGAADDDGRLPPDLPVYRAVVSARHHGSGARELSGGLVTITQDIPAQGDQSILGTLEAFGREPGDCLAPGDFFTLWRGRDLARGIVTRRIFV